MFRPEMTLTVFDNVSKSIKLEQKLLLWLHFVVFKQLENQKKVKSANRIIFNLLFGFQKMKSWEELGVSPI